MITFNAISVFAISKTELESNPERYIIISESTDGNGYCDYSNTKVIANTDTTATIKTKIYQVFNTKQMITTCDYDFIYNKERSTKNLTELVMSKPEARAMPEYFVNQLKALDSGVKVHKYNFKVFNFSGKDITPLKLHGYEKTMTAEKAPSITPMSMPKSAVTHERKRSSLPPFAICAHMSRPR